MTLPLGAARRRRAGRENGFTYVVVLVLIAVLGVGLAKAGMLWSDLSRREREADLLFAGAQFRAAIESYAKSSPGAPELPKKLEDLLEDRRSAATRRHLRRIYADPMTGRRDWALVMQGDRIAGVHSRSTDVPFKTAGFSSSDQGFEGGRRYSDWKFVYQPAGAQQPKQATGGPGSPVTGAMPPVSPGPVAATPPPTEAPVVVTVPVPPRKETPQECDGQRAEDLVRCAALRDGGSPVAQIAQCNASATARFLACSRGAAVPPLKLP